MAHPVLSCVVKTWVFMLYGNVGSLVAKIAKGFGMKVFAFDPFVAKETIEADGVTVLDSVEDLYSKCDYISLHIPANKHTIKSINYELLSKMKTNAVLVNTARKEVINEDDIIKNIEFEIDEVKNHLANLIDFAINYFKQIKKKYGKGRERKTEIRNFDTIQASMVAAATQKTLRKP